MALTELNDGIRVLEVKVGQADDDGIYPVEMQAIMRIGYKTRRAVVIGSAPDVSAEAFNNGAFAGLNTKYTDFVDSL